MSLSKLIIFIIIIKLFLLTSINCDDDDDDDDDDILFNKKLTDIVQTDKGPVRGEIVWTIRKSIKYSSFRAIPYAKPPIGQLRFKPPVEHDTWKKVINATNEAPLCPQLNRTDRTYVKNSDESCLYLNVYTPKTKFDGNNNKLLAVMVWIHGGGFLEGTSASQIYGPDFLIEKNVVVVTMNYRLGALGFLSLDIPEATGNMGLKDQVLALKWTQKNIKKFGGDPNRVTIFGQSAGACSVSLHQISDASKGLFNASIAMSGSVLNNWGFSSRITAVSHAFILGTKLKLLTLNKKKLLKKLLSATPEELVRATASIKILDLFFKPTSENKKIATDIFLSECPIKKFKRGNYHHTPMILGFVKYEMLGIDLFPGSSNYDEINKKLECQSYFDSTCISRENRIIYNLINITSDITFVAGIDITQQYLAKSSSKSIYYYRNSFDYDSSYHKISGINKKYNGTAHADDLFHIFWWSNSNQSLDPNSDIYFQRKRMVKLWTNFAKYHNPTPSGLDDIFLNVTWNPSGKEGMALEIGQKSLIMQTRPTSNFVKKIQKSGRLFDEIKQGCFL